MANEKEVDLRNMNTEEYFREMDKKMPKRNNEKVLAQHSEGNVDTPSLKDEGTF